MATITKTIKASGGDYATPELAAAAVVAGTISGAIAGDSIILKISDNTRFDSTFTIASLAVAYASVTLTTDPLVRHTGLPGTGGGISRTTGASGHIISCSANNCQFIIEWLEVTTNGGKLNSGIYIHQTANSAAANIVRNNLVYNNGQPTAAQTDGIRIVGIPTDVINNVVWNWKSQQAYAASGINISAGTGSIVRRLYNNTIYDIDCSGSGTCRGISSVAPTFESKNNAIARVGTNTSGTKECIGGSVAATRNNNATSDSTATGTGAVINLIESDAWVSPSTGDFTPKNSGGLFQAGADLGTTPSGIEIDLKGHDRDLTGYIWSIGGFQDGNVALDAIHLIEPTANKMFQRSGGGTATVAVNGTYTSSGGGAIEYRFNGSAWATLVASPSAGAFSTTVSLPTGQGTFEVRLAAQVTVTDSAAYVTVGDIYAIYGQSNASGRGTNNRTYTGSFRALQYTGSGWQELADPADSDTKYLDPVASDSGAAAGHWCHKMVTDLMASVGVPVGVMIVAIGGTGITSFLPSADHVDRETLYGSLNYHIGAIGGVKCVLWWQGETDAISAMSQATYNGHLDTLANAIQTDRSIKLMSCLLQNSSGITDGNEANIRAAVTEAVGNNANVLDGPDFSAIGSDDAYHFTTNTKVDNAGALWASAIAATFFPSITAVTIDTPIALVGSASTITWSSVGVSSTVDILLSKDGGSTFPTTIVAGTANDGSYAWTPTNANLTATGMIKVRDTANASYFDNSDAMKVATTSLSGGSSITGVKTGGIRTT